MTTMTIHADCAPGAAIRNGTAEARQGISKSMQNPTVASPGLYRPVPMPAAVLMRQDAAEP